MLEKNWMQLFPRQGPRVRATEPIGGGGDEIFLDDEQWKTLPTLRHQANAATGDRLRRSSSYGNPSEANRSGEWRDQTDDRADGRGLTHAVAAKQRDDLTFADRERNVGQDAAAAIARLQALD